MKKILFTFAIILFFTTAFAGQPFIKTIDDLSYGTKLRVLPTSDKGWAVFSKDSLRLTKFNSCGFPEWSKKYFIPSTYASLTDFIQTQSGGYALLTRMDNGSKSASLITTFDAAGQLLWSKSYEDTFYDQFPYSISTDNTGNLVVFANTDHVDSKPLYNLVLKVDPNGNIIWSKLYDHGGTWGGAIVTSDNGVLVRTGNIFFKIDPTGQVQWTSQAFSPTYNFLAPAEVSDGYIFTAYSNAGNNICFFKLDKQGNQLWNGYKKSSFTGNPPVLYRKPNGNLAGVFNKTIVEFDKDLFVMQQSTLDSLQPPVNFTGVDLCFQKDNTPILAGIIGKKPFFSKMEKDYSTDCSVLLPLLTYLLEPLTIHAIGTNDSSYTLAVVNHNFISDTISVTVSDLCKKQKYLDLGQDTSVCKGSFIFLQNKTTDEFDHYLWSTGDTTKTLSINQPGTYWLTAYDECESALWTDTLVVNLLPAVLSDVGEDILKCEGIQLELFAPFCDSCLYTWNTGSHSGSIQVEMEGFYWLTINNTNGCSSTDTVWIEEVKCNCSLYIPNSFTPNEDGKNEQFIPSYDCEIRNYSLTIFNRLGQKVFGSNQISEGWQGIFNGKKVMEGIYVYVIQYDPVINGQLNKTIRKAGTVAVIY